MTASCRWMTDFFEKFFYTARVGLSQMKTKAKVKDEFSCIFYVKSALNITTTWDSCYQTTNKRKNNNPKVQIKMDKLKILLIWLRIPHVLRYSNLKHIPS